MRKLPLVLFVAVLTLGVSYSYWQHKTSVANNAAFDAQLNTLKVQRTDADTQANNYLAMSQVAERTALEERIRAGELPPSALKQYDAAHAKPIQEPEPSTVTMTIPVRSESVFTPSLVMQCGISILFSIAALFIILAQRYAPTDKHWAYATLGTIIGFWFKSAG